ncbi:helix-turn-helix domain-containing protein [Streptomyces sp. PTM05]|uniref:Helix-turn-helix domain-containing protein n=1 Tax=Streptantibioticus parmotrematis TaxID=2873249 RepID=A0ABS7QRH8_9ACTN|nr:DNA-3-methyladenine glycosylase 2 family protein [Streptantibioticus parmotrematis]MBY8885791.1 helix-turn-helix domain-containing protein [Streptantibioticus parmotrematis]
MIDAETGYQAVRSRDARFDGVFFTAVRTTGIYCRPSCPAVTPKRHNVSFYPTAAAAQSAGYRACRRCRPDAVPGSPEWDVRADLVGRAMRLIRDGVVDRDGVAGLAERLGYSERQVHRQLTAEVGAGPVALARAQRAQTARVLLQTTALPITQVAFAAGFASVRQFNDSIREIYDRTPTELRAAAPAPRPGRTPAGAGRAVLSLRLAHRGPYDAAAVFDYLRRHAVPGIEEVVGAPDSRRYRRTLRLPHGAAVAEVAEPNAAARAGSWLECRLRLSDLRDLTTAVQRVRRLFDLDADPGAVTARLGADPLLGPLVAARPGLRSPGSADPAETALCAVAGSPRAAGDLVAAYGDLLPGGADGGLTHLFPTAATLADAYPAEYVDPAVRAVAAALDDGTLRLDPGADRERSAGALRALPGVGLWTTGYVRMRALGDPDVFLPTGVVDEETAERWRPWRSYALHHLWQADRERSAAVGAS